MNGRLQLLLSFMAIPLLKLDAAQADLEKKLEVHCRCLIGRLQTSSTQLAADLAGRMNADT